MQVLYAASTLFLKSLSMATDCTSVIKETDQKEIKGQWFAFFFKLYPLHYPYNCVTLLVLQYKLPSSVVRKVTFKCCEEKKQTHRLKFLNFLKFHITIDLAPLAQSQL